MKLLNSFFVLSFSLLLFVFSSCGDSNTAGNTNQENLPKEETTTTETPIKEESIISTEELISAIVKSSKDIAVNLTSAYTHEKKRYVDDSEPGNYFQVDFDTYSDADGNLVKFYVKGGEGGYLSETSYYFKNGELILEDTQESYMDKLEMHQRVFFQKGEILKVEQKSNLERDETIDLKAASFGTSPDYIEDKAKFAESHKNEYTRYTEYLKKAEVVK